MAAVERQRGFVLPVSTTETAAMQSLSQLKSKTGQGRAETVDAE